MFELMCCFFCLLLVSTAQSDQVSSAGGIYVVSE